MVQSGRRAGGNPDVARRSNPLGTSRHRRTSAGRRIAADWRKPQSERSLCPRSSPRSALPARPGLLLAQHLYRVRSDPRAASLRSQASRRSTFESVRRRRIFRWIEGRRHALRGRFSSRHVRGDRRQKRSHVSATLVARRETGIAAHRPRLRRDAQRQSHVLSLGPGRRAVLDSRSGEAGDPAGTEDVVVARLKRHPRDSSWFTASLVSSQSGGKIREAAIKVDAPTPATDSLEKLADFIVTGKAQGAIVVVDDAQPSPPPRISGPQPMVQSTPDSADAWRVGSYASFGVSAAAAASALVLLLVNRADLNRLKSYEKPDGNLTNAPDVPGLVHAIDTRRGTATVLFVASGVAAASGVAFYFLARKQEYPRMDVSIAVNRTGGLLLVGTGF